MPEMGVHCCHSGQVDSADEDSGKTALLEACRSGHCHTVRVLLDCETLDSGGSGRSCTPSTQGKDFLLEPVVADGYTYHGRAELEAKLADSKGATSATNRGAHTGPQRCRAQC